jgi:hypothetical protein
MISSFVLVFITAIDRFANQSHRFIDAYARGLTGSQATWAAHKYQGHRVLPESIMNDLEKENIV